MIDLHLHLDGSLTAEELIWLAGMQNIMMPTKTPEALMEYIEAPENTQSLNDYLKCFDLPLTILQTQDALEQAVYMLSMRLANSGMLYAEIRFAPQLHTHTGMTQAEAVAAAIRGRDRANLEANGNFKANLILCCMRGENNTEENYETLNIARKHLGAAGVCAVDLAGAEAVYITSEYTELFARAKQLELPFTIHAGEADGPQSVRDAISFGARRIGHGVRSIESEETMQVLAERKIPLELCPKSNLDTKAVSDISNYPVRSFLERGIVTTINSDNMTVSNTSVKNEFALLKEGIDLTEAERRKLLLNSVEAAFVTEAEKEELRKKLEQRL